MQTSQNTLKFAKINSLVVDILNEICYKVALIYVKWKLIKMYNNVKHRQKNFIPKSVKNPLAFWQMSARISQTELRYVNIVQDVQMPSFDTASKAL